MIYTRKIRNAYHICVYAHKDDVDISGYPYIMHAFYLASQMDDEDSTIVALLHDVIELHSDKIDLNYMINAGMGKRICYSLDLLTRKKGVPYMRYIRDIKKDPLARKVKIADLKHDTDINRLHNYHHPKYDLYMEALEYLESD